MKIKRHISIAKIILFSILLLYVLSMVSLLLWGLINSFKTNREFIIEKNYFGFARKFEIQNYIDVITKLEVPVTRNGKSLRVTILGLIVNTLFYAGGGALVATVSPLIIGYACAKYKNFYSRMLESVTLLTMMVTVIGNEASYFRVLNALGIYDTFFGFYAMKFNFAGIYMLLFKGAFGGVSSGFAEAAKIDGASELQTMIKIMFPLVFGLFGTVFLVNFVSYWNDYSTVMLYLPTRPNLAYSIYNLVYVTTTPQLNVTPKKLAGCMVLVVPIFIIFMVFRDKFMSNLAEGGIKG